MFKVFTAPTELFSRLREQPAWLLPLVLAIVAGLAVTAVSAHYFDWTAQRDAVLERLEQSDMPSDQREQALERMEQFHTNPLMRYGLPLAGGLITQVVAFLFLALVYNLSLPLLGGSGNYRRVLSVTAHAGLVAIPAALLRVVLILLSGSAQATTSLLLAFPEMKSGFFQVVLSRVDPFIIWQLVLTGLGLKVVFGLKGAKSYWLVVAVWVLVTLVFAGMAGLGSG